MLPSITQRRWTALCLILLALLPFGLFWQVTLLQRVFADGDLYAYNYPLLHTIAQQWRAGELPLWNPYIFGGTPLHANMQGGGFYPPNLLLLLAPVWMAYQYCILLHYSMAGIFTFLYLRALSLARTAALFGAIVFMLGGFGMGTLGHVSTLRTYPWLPLILFGFEKWRRTVDGRYAVLAGTAMGLMLVAGHPQIPLYALVVSGAYACRCVLSAAKPQRARLGTGCALSFLLGAGLAAIQILPTLQLAVEEYLRPADRSYEYFVTFSLPPVLLANLVFPRIIPSDESELAVYVGISTLVLALLGAWRSPAESRVHRGFFLAVATVALVLALGKWTPLSPLLFRVPLYNLFMCPARKLFEFDFACAVLAALGVQVMRDPSADGRACRKAVVAFVLLGCVGLLVAMMTLVPEPGTTFDSLLVALMVVTWQEPSVLGRLPILLASLGLVFFFPSARRWRSVSSCALLVLLVVDLFSYAKGIYGLHPPSVYTERPAVLDFLKKQAEPGRILTLEQPEDDPPQDVAMLSPDGNATYDVESINGFDSLMLRQIDLASGHVMPTYGLIAGPGTYAEPQFQRFIDLLNTRYVLTPVAKPLDLPPPRYRTVYADDRVRVLENTQALPRFFLTPAVRVATRQQVLDVLASGRLDGAPFDPLRVALVEARGEDADGSQPLPLPLPNATQRRESIRVLSDGPGRIRLTVDTPRPAFLVHSTSYSRGWRAFVDGSPVPVSRVNGLVQGLPLSQGHHQVTIEYRPASFRIGAAVGLLSLLLASAFCVPRRR